MKRWLLSALLFVGLATGVSWATRIFAPPVAAQATQANQPKQDPETITVYVTRTGMKYHRDGCRFLAKSKIPMSLKDAAAKGYEPCKVCKPPVAQP